MKLEEDLKSVRYIREYIDLVVNDEGYVILPAWQFARFVDQYESYRTSTIMWFLILAIAAVVIVITTMLR